MVISYQVKLVKLLNLSDYIPNENEKFVIEEGLRFSVPSQKQHRECIFSEFEILSGQLKHHKPFSQTKLDSCYAKLYDLSHSFHNSRINNADFKMFKNCNLAYKSLKSNTQIVILKADKGTSFVILNKEEYLNKMKTILDDKSKFIMLGPVEKADSTVKIEKAFQQKLRSWFVKGYISQDVYESIRPTGSQCPKLYGLPKTHKKGCPCRPILDMVNSSQYKIAKFLIPILSQVSNKFSHFCVKDSFNFVENIRNNRCLPDQMCSFDIKSLFTNVPIDTTINICINELYNSNLNPPMFPKEVCQSLLYMAVKNVEFRFNNYIYRQVDGVAMSSHLGPVLANIFVGYFESIFFTNIEKRLNYFTHVVDIFISYKKGYNVNTLFDQISNLHPSLKFTREHEVDDSLPFLYVLVQRTPTSLVTSIYRKPTFVGQYIPWQSFCPTSQKTNLISCLVFRAHKICSNLKLNDEIENITNIFGSLGYPMEVIKKTIDKTLAKLVSPTKHGPNKCPVYLRLPFLGKEAKFLENQLKETINNTFGAVNLRISHSTRKPLNGIVKDVTPDPEKCNVIYKYKCHCDSVYIGRTSQRFHIRRDQHISKALRNWMINGQNKPIKSPSAIGDHLLNNPDCSKHYSDNKFSIISKGRNLYHLSVLESLFIKTYKPNLCKQKFVYNSNLFKLL